MIRERKDNFSFLVAILYFALSVFLCTPVVQNVLLVFGGKILERALNFPYAWKLRMFRLGFIFCLLGIYTTFKLFKVSTKNYHFGSSRFSCAFVFLVLLLIAFSASSLFYLFPLGSQELGADSSAFIYIGRGMHRGKIPYKDMFDHKGLYLYFLEYIATFFSGTKGVYLLELINLFVTSLCIFKLTEFATNDMCVQFLTVVCIVWFAGVNVYDGGNFVEEFAFPCIAYSNYVYFKWLNKNKFNFVEFLITGIAFGVVIFLRVNMIGIWIFYVLYFLVSLCAKKRFILLIKMAVAFVIGVIIAFVPALLYLHFTKSFSDMWDAYILFNFKYISEQNGIKSNLIVAGWFIQLLLVPFLCLIIDFLRNSRKKIHLINFIGFFVTLFFVVVSGRKFHHYGIILLPFFALPIGKCLKIIKQYVLYLSDKKRFILKYLVQLIMVTIVLLMPLCIPTNEKESMLTFVQENTKSDADVLMLGYNMRVYIISERYTKERFFYQLPILKIRSTYMQEFLQSVKHNPPDCVVVPENFKTYLNSDIDFRFIADLLQDNYKKAEFDNGDVYIKI